VATVGGAIRALLDRVYSRLARRRYRSVRFVGSLTEVPAAIDRSTVWVVLDGARAKWGVFDCPCDMGHRITLSLQGDHHRHWRLSLGSGHPTLWPSIDAFDGKRCHFWITDGRVRWVLERETD
jgi:uncharacterized protein DUF6527